MQQNKPHQKKKGPKDIPKQVDRAAPKIWQICLTGNWRSEELEASKAGPNRTQNEGTTSWKALMDSIG